MYKEFIPGEELKQYVKCYYVYEPDTDTVFDDMAFATGCMEVMFNLGSNKWQISTGNGFKTTPAVELWGQIIRPLAFKSPGKNTMLGIRFYPYTAFAFLNDDINLFNNQVTDFTDVAGKQVQILHSRLLEADSTGERLRLVGEFLLQRLCLSEKKRNKTGLISNVMKELKRDDFFDSISDIASRYGITSRYLQKLFLQYTGLTPKLYRKINRFQQSLQLVAKKNSSLTSIAYECGYSDQSHFIREFRSFAGITPSSYNPENSSAILISPD
jgi:AraC-like DNA-binding protein